MKPISPISIIDKKEDVAIKKILRQEQYLCKKDLIGKDFSHQRCGMSSAKGKTSYPFLKSYCLRGKIPLKGVPAFYKHAASAEAGECCRSLNLNRT